MRRLLILACTQRKRAAPDLLPALLRYDGPTFLVLRKYLREQQPEGLTVFILSGKYGLITADKLISNYDTCLHNNLDESLRLQIHEQWVSLIAQSGWSRIGLCMGKKYWNFLKSIVPTVEHESLEYLHGGLGLRLTALRRWLQLSGTTAIKDN